MRGGMGKHKHDRLKLQLRSGVRDMVENYFEEGKRRSEGWQVGQTKAGEISLTQ